MTAESRALRCCDLVMKGGITSGVLYPPAIARIAEGFHLVGIGGTSAGAIAACAAAAAEYRRRHGGGMAGFQRLEEVPHDLMGDGRLLALFRPDGATEKLFRLFLQALEMGERSAIRRALWKLKVAWLALGRREATLRPAIANGYGICSGMAAGLGPHPTGVPPLTEWLTAVIDEIAGLDDGGPPLTFGDLRRAPIPEHLQDTMTGMERRSIDLRAVTTCVSFGRPMELPLDGRHIFAFDPTEWRGLFPERVVAHLEACAEAVETDAFADSGLLPLPTGDDLPVVVAARMSLSFPGLFTMVPLHAVDYEDPKQPYRKVWFSDGGITSNFPIHRFDALFPRWPTLAINLQYTDAPGDTPRRNLTPDGTFMIQRTSDGTRDLWNAFDRRDGALGAFLGFGGAIFRAAQVWHDNAYLALPGYRDRVVEIWLDPKEGGMNLTMPDDVIASLIRRGEAAGLQIRDRFLQGGPSPGLSWDGHRWIRFRSSMAGLVAYLRGFETSAAHPLPGDDRLEDLLDEPDRAPSKPFASEQLEQVEDAVEDLRAFIQGLDAGPPTIVGHEPDVHPFCDPPRPRIQIGSRAPF
jgi:hypothetical protein